MGTAVRPPESPAAAAAIPRRAPGLELLGRYEDSGFKEPPYMARRADGQVVQLSQLLYVVLEAVDGERDEAAVAAAASERIGRRLSADDAGFLIARKLRPQGLLAGADGRAPALEKREAALALRRRRPLVSAERVQPLARIFQPLLHFPVVALVLAALIGVDAWLFFDHGVAGALRSALYEPVLLLAVFAAMIAGTAFHELGHAAACRFSGARPGAIGAGVYLVWPAFYCDVTEAYRLPRRGRLRTDLGGVYFNAIFALLFAGAFFLTGAEVLLLVVVVQHFTVAQQLLPLLRFDGYYVLTDLTGVPDILSRVRPILRSLIPGRKPEPSVDALKPWVRRVTALYLALVVPLVAGLVLWVVLGAPRLFATIFDSLVRHGERAAAAARDGEVASGLVAALEMGALALPLVAMSLTLWRLGQLAVALVRRWTRGSRRRQALALAAAAVAGAFLAASWWPDGDYTPLRPGERLTVTQVYASPLQVRELGAASAPAETRTRTAATRPDRAPARRATPEHGRLTEAPSQPAATPGEPEQETASAPAAEDEPAAPAGTEASPQPGSTAQASPEPAATATPIPQPGAGDPTNEARAVNTVDGSRLFELAFSIQRVRGGEPLAHTNIAQALASCTACRTVAIAVQVVIVMGGSQLAAPINFAESLNSVCTACQTLALAWQLVVTTPGEVELTQEALRRIEEIERELTALETSDASVEEIRAAADQLLRDLRETVLTGLAPTAGAAKPDTEESTTTGREPSTKATPTPTAEPEPSEPAPQGEATPEPTPEPEPEETSEPTSEPTPTPTPEGTAQPTPTAEAP